MHEALSACHDSIYFIADDTLAVLLAAQSDAIDRLILLIPFRRLRHHVLMLAAAIVTPRDSESACLIRVDGAADSVLPDICRLKESALSAFGRPLLMPDVRDVYCSKMQ